MALRWMKSLRCTAGMVAAVMVAMAGAAPAMGNDVPPEVLFDLPYQTGRSLDLSKLSWRVMRGDDHQWKAIDFDDSQWQDVEPGVSLRQYGMSSGFHWYRTAFELPEELAGAEAFLLDLGAISFFDEVYLNEELVGTFGKHPPDQPISGSSWVSRRYVVSGDQVRADGKNVLAIRVYSGAFGGLHHGPYALSELKYPIVVDYVLKGEGRDGLLTQLSEASHLNHFYWRDPVRIQPRLYVSDGFDVRQPIELRIDVQDAAGEIVDRHRIARQVEPNPFYTFEPIQLDLPEAGQFTCVVRITQGGVVRWEQEIALERAVRPERMSLPVDESLAEVTIEPTSSRRIHEDSVGSFGGRYLNDENELDPAVTESDVRGALAYVSRVAWDDPSVLLFQNNVAASPKQPLSPPRLQKYAQGRRYDGYNDIWSFGHLAIDGTELREDGIEVVSVDWSHRRYRLRYEDSPHTLEFTVSKHSPAFRVTTDADEVRVFDRLSEWGVGQPTRIAFESSSGIRIADPRRGFAGEAMRANWALVWFNGAEGWSLFDIPWLFVFERRPDRVSVKGDALHFNFAAEAGALFGMPLFGVRQASLYETARWQQEIPEPVVEQVRFWSQALLAYPVFCERTFATDFTNDRLHVEDRYTFQAVADAWGTEPVKVAPVSPMVALSALSGNIPIAFDAEVYDPQLTTLYGPWSGVRDTDTVRFRADGLLHRLREVRVTDGIDREDEIYAEAVEVLENAMAKAYERYELDQHPWPWSFWGSGNNNNRLHPGSLARDWSNVLLALPYVSTDVQSMYRHAMAGEVEQTILLDGEPNERANERLRKDLRGKSQVVHLRDRINGLEMAIELSGAGRGTDGPFWESQRLYVLWQFAHYLDEWDAVLDAWPLLNRYFNLIAHSHDWASAVSWDHYSGYRIGNGLQESGGMYAGLLAFARMADRVGDPDLASYASYLASMQLIGTNAAATGIEYVRKHRPWASAHSDATAIAASERPLAMRYVEINEFAGISQYVINGISFLRAIFSYVHEPVPEVKRVYREIWTEQNRYFFDQINVRPFTNVVLHMKGGDEDEVHAAYQRDSQSNLQTRILGARARIESLGRTYWEPQYLTDQP